MMLTLIGGLFFVLIFFILLYWGLINRKKQVDQAWFRVVEMLKKRHAFIPKLFRVVSIEEQHEQALLDQVKNWYDRSSDIKLLDDQAKMLENRLSTALTQLIIAIENRPNNEANMDFIRLKEEVERIESELGAARRAYNAAVLNYNNALEMFPSNLVAFSMHLSRASHFEIGPQANAAIRLSEIYND